MRASAQRWLQRVDRAIGPVLCRVVPSRAHGPKNTRPDHIEKLLIVRPGGIGDAALSFPLIKALKSVYPEAIVDVLAERRNMGVYRINHLVRCVHCYDRAPLTSMVHLVHEHYDAIVDTEQFHHLSALMVNTLGPKWFVGFDTLGRRKFQTHSAPYSDADYEVHSFLALAEALTGRTFAFDPEEPFIEVASEHRSWAAGVTKGEPFAAIVPIAGSRLRHWPPERYAAVVRWLTTRGIRVVLLGGTDARESAAKIPGALDLTGRTTLAQSAALIADCRVYLSADTGTLHLAYGVGTPTVSLFGSGIQSKWAPIGRRHRVVNKHLPCSPCTHFGQTPPCPYNVACMEHIRVEDVTAALNEVL